MTDATAPVRRFFAERGVHVEIQTFDASVHTAQQAAQALGTEARTIVKSLGTRSQG